VNAQGERQGPNVLASVMGDDIALPWNANLTPFDDRRLSNDPLSHERT
jgi:hypothetical protein